MCHPDLAKKKVVHAAVSMGCPTCHASLNAAEMPHKVTGNVPKGLSSAVPDLCYGCHDKTKFNDKTVHPPVAGGMCTSCHNPHSADNPKLLLAPAPALCYSCHDKSAFTRKNVHAAVSMGCASCHNPHASGFRKMLQDDINKVCTTCHTQSVFKERLHAVRGHPMEEKDLSVKAKGQGFSCVSCHDPHSSNSKSLWKFTANSTMEFCAHCHKK
jgi:predicted CXXCH cytochrome family protein